MFAGRDFNSLVLYIDEIQDDEEEFVITVRYLCACGKSVYRMKSPDFGFACVHCDSICKTKNCEACIALMSVDFGEPDANI